MRLRLLALPLLLLGARAASAATVSWTGAAVGDWGVGTNWSGGSVPGAADDATIASAFVVAYATDAPLSLNSLTLGSGAVLNLSTGIAVAGAADLQGGAALQFASTVTFSAGTFLLERGSSATYTGAPFPNGSVPSLTLNAAAFLLAGGSTITLSGRGYAGGAGGASPTAGSGPSGGGGAGSATPTGGGGGGHAAAGGDGAADANGSAAYDGLPPTDGGAGGGGAPNAAGGAGGGFLTVVATTATIDGRIEADGLAGETFGFSGAGGGAGGAVLIRAEVLRGTGTITARGGAGGSAATAGGGGGSGGIVWIKEFPTSTILRSTLTVTATGGAGGSAATFGASGGAGLKFEDPRHWAATAPGSAASTPGNWSGGIVPSGGETVVFGSSATAIGCLWDLGSVAIGSVTVGASFSTSVVLQASMTVTGTFDLQGGTVTALSGLDLGVGGAFTQTGGRLDLAGSTMTLAAAGASANASFLDATAGLLLVGAAGASASTAGVTGALSVSSAVFVDAAATLSLSSASLSLGGDGPFFGPGSVNLTTATDLTANGASSQTWTGWPGAAGSLTVTNPSAAGLTLSTVTVSTYTLGGGVVVGTASVLSAPGARLEVGGDWAVYGAAALDGSTVAFRAVSGTQTISAGGRFDNLVVDDAGAELTLSTWVVAASSVGVLSGTLDLAASTITVRGRWTEAPGAKVLPGTSLAVFDGTLPTSIYQLGGNSFGSFISSAAGGVSISSTLAASGSFEWHRGNLSYPGAAITVGGDMLVRGGIVLTPAGSTVVFNGASTQTVTFNNFGTFVDANTGPDGVVLSAAFVSVGSFFVRPGSVLNGAGSTLNAAGPVWDTALSTYVASNPAHAVRWIPASTMTVAAGSVVNAKVTVFSNKTAVLLGDLTIGGAGDFLDFQSNSFLVNAPGGSTITFKDSADLIPSGASNWSYGGDAANSWLVFEGSGSSRGAFLPVNSFGSIRVSLDTSSDAFKINNLNLTGSFVVTQGTAKPNGATTLSLGGDLIETGGLVDYAALSSGTVVLTGPSTQTVRMPGVHTLWNLTDASTAAVAAASDLVVGGDFTVAGGTFSAGSGALALRGAVVIATGAYFDGQASTVTLDGASVGKPSQNLAAYGAASFNGLAVNVLSANLLTSATAAVFADAVAGGTVTVTAGAQLTAADLRLGPAAGARLTARSSSAGAPWFLKATAVSSATAVAVSDSNASLGIPILANDGRSDDRGGNSNWVFNPLLLVLLPGETFTPNAAPGKSGAPSASVAGASITATVIAVSSRFEQAFAATGTVTLTSDDAYAALPSSQALTNGTTTLTFTPFSAEPAPRATRVTATAFFGSGVSTASVSPGGLTKLQVVMFGQTAAPGSPSGVTGSPFARVKNAPFSATVRAVDAYWNLVTTVTDSIALGTDASTAAIPAPPALSGGLSQPGGLILYATGFFTLTATDLTEPAVASATGAAFGVVPPSVSSPTGAFFVPTGAAVTTLGGAISGTAADSSSVERVRVDVLDVEAGLHFDASAKTFSAAAAIYSTTTLAAPLSAATSWANPVPDSALTDGHHYAATAIVDDPTGFSGTAVSTFVVDRSALRYAARSGEGAASALPASVPGCEAVTATVAFTVGGSGLGAGGAVAVRVPDGWTPPVGLSSSTRPPAGYWSVTSTSAATAPAISTVAVNPAALRGQPLGAGWLLLSVATSAGTGYLPGERIVFAYTGLPPLSPSGRGNQVFSLWTTADGGGPLAPISSQPAVNLTPGTTTVFVFEDSTPLELTAGQTSPTMRMKAADLCGNDKLGLSSGTAVLSLVVPSAGGYATDGTALFHFLSGSTITAVGVSTGVSLSPSFTMVTSTSGPTLAYIRAVSSYTATTSSGAVVMRAVHLGASAAAFTGVSVDTGALSPGTTSVALSSSVPDAYSARVVFTLSDPAVAWDAVASLDAVNFSTPAFRATGFGDASRPIVLGWDGVDRVTGAPTRARPGHYRVRLRAGGGAATNASLEIVVSTTAGYAGRLGAGGAFARVRALGPGAGDGAAAQASATGYFLLSGLREGQAYQLTVATQTFVAGWPVLLSTAIAGPAAVIPAADLGAVALPAPARVRVSAILPVAAPFETVGGFVGRAADGSAAFSGALRFSTGAAVSDDGGPLFGRAASTWSVALAEPGVYTLELDVPDLRLTTKVPGIAVGASGADLTAPFAKLAGAFGTVTLPSVAASSVTVSVQAAKAGSGAPAAFASIVTSTGGAYALYGLDPGTWTVLASAPGYAPSSATALVTGASDLSGVNLTLGAGGTIVGTVTVTGDSRAAAQCFAGAGGAPGACPAGTFDLSVEALAVGTLDRGAVRARLTGSAASSSATYAISGLAPGLWTLRSSLPGFTLAPAGGLTVSVAAAAVSTSALSLAPADARLALTVLLPPPAGGGCLPAAAWTALGFGFDAADGTSRVFDDATALTGPGSFETLNCSSATFFSPALPPGPARASALYAPGGSWAFDRALLVAGTTASVTLDLRASSVAVSGLVSVSGPLSVATTTAAGAPYTVAASSAPGLFAAAANQSFCLYGSSQPAAQRSFRVELVPDDPIAGTPPLRRATGGPGSCAAPAASTEAATSLAFTAILNPDGSFQFSPGVVPGRYRLRVPGDLDGDPANGDEAVPYDQPLLVGAGGIAAAASLGRGARVSGTLSAPSSLPAGRLFRLSLIGPDGAAARSVLVTPAPGGSTAFAFDGVADGRYAVTVADQSSPRAFAAAAAPAVVAGADAAGLSLVLGPSATVRARLAVTRLLPDGTRQAVLITAENAGLLGPGFTAVARGAAGLAGDAVSARTDPSGALVDAEGRVVIDGLAPGSYDVAFSAPPDAAAAGAGAVALAPARVAGVVLGPGQAADLGVVPLFVGSFVSGRVVDAATGLPVSGVGVSARASDAGGAAPGAAASDLTATTDAAGDYLLRGLDPSRRWYDVTAAPRGGSLSGAPAAPYASRRALGVDASSGAVVDFSLTRADGSVTGRVAAANGAALASSSGPGEPAGPGAVVTLQAGGVPPSEDPLADLSLRTAPDGTFTIPAVAAGSYRLTASALGAGNAALAVVVGSTATNLGTVTLGAGGSLSGAVRLPDGSSPSVDEVRAISAASPDAQEFHYAALTVDPTGRSVVGYSLGGLTPGTTYRLVVSGPGGVAYVPPEAAAVVLTSTADARLTDLTLRPAAGPVSFRASRSGTRWTVSALFPRPVRARFTADSDPAVLLSTVAATGALSGGLLSADRRTVSATYDAGPGESSAVFRASASLSATDWSASDPAARELAAAATAALSLAGDGLTRASASNALGTTLTLDGDAGRVVLPRGAFAVDASSSVTVTFSRSASGAAFAAGAPPAPVAGDYYDISPAAGVPSALARPAELTLAYSTAVADPSRLHAYWFNPAAGAYILQPDALGAAPVVDASARTVTLRVKHFSTYVLLDSGAGVIGGAAFGGGELDAYNFPNPFDLSVKTVTTIHGGGAPTIRGTLIRISVPPGLSGGGTLRVFEITGRLVRTIDLGLLSAGQIYYQGWDGRTDAGLDVASGLYLGQVEVGSRRKTFKMAVLK